MTALKLDLEFGLISGPPVFCEFPAEEGEMMQDPRAGGSPRAPPECLCWRPGIHHARLYPGLQDSAPP